MNVTCEEIDDLIPAGPARHYCFARFVLGESHMVAAAIASSCRDEPLPLSAMRIMAKRWNFPELTPLGAHP